MDPITLLGASAAATQFAGSGAKSLLNLISLVRAFQDTPAQIQELLRDVENSVARMVQLQTSVQDPNSELMKGVSARQVLNIQNIVKDSHAAIDELHAMLEPLVKNRDGTQRTGVIKAWKAIRSLVQAEGVEKKLRRIQRLGADLDRQLVVAGLEVQSAAISKTVSPILETNQNVRQLVSRFESYAKTSATAEQEMKQRADEVQNLVQQHNDSVLAKTTSIESELSTLQPGISSMLSEQQSFSSQIVQVSQRVETLADKTAILTTSANDILRALTNPQPSSHLITDLQTLKSIKDDISNEVVRKLVTYPQALRNVLEINSRSSRHLGDSASFRWRAAPSNRRSRKKYRFGIWLPPLLRKSLVLTFELTHGAGGYSIHHSLHVFARVKRSDSPIFQAIDRYRNLFCIISESSFGAPSTEAHLQNLLQQVQEILTSGLASLTDRDERGRAPSHGIIELFMRLEFYRDYSGDYLPSFMKLFTEIDLDLSEPTFIEVPAVSSLSVESEGSLTIHEAIMAHDVWRCLCRDPTGSSVLLPYIHEVDSDEISTNFYSTIRTLKSKYPCFGIFGISQDRWCSLLHTFPDPTGLGAAITKRSLQQLSVCLDRWDGVFPVTWENFEPDIGWDETLWALRTCPLELSLGWVDGLRLILNAGAPPKRALVSAIELGHIESIRTLLSEHLIKGVTVEDIFSVLDNRPGCQLRVEVRTELLTAIKSRRQSLLSLALRYLPTGVQSKLDLSPGTLLDSKAFDTYNALQELGVQIPHSLSVTTKRPIYHRLYHTVYQGLDQVSWLDMVFNTGFREIDAELEGRTPLEMICWGSADWRMSASIWFISKNAKPRMSSRRGWGHDVFTLAYNHSARIIERKWPMSDCQYEELSNNDWHGKLHFENSAKMILRHYVRSVSNSVKDTCRCYCSSTGCSPAHFFLPVRVCLRTVSRVARSTTDHILQTWCDWTDCPMKEVRELYEESCRLGMFERLGMVHTCLPHDNICSEPSSPLELAEADEIREDDAETNSHLELLMRAYRTSRDLQLPRHPSLTDYSRHLTGWWDEVDVILPERACDFCRDDRIRFAVQEAGYGYNHDPVREGNEHAILPEPVCRLCGDLDPYRDPLEPDFLGRVGVGPKSASQVEDRIPDYSSVIRRHFARWLGEEDEIRNC